MFDNYGLIDSPYGMKIIESLNCVEFTGKTLTREEKRTWKERLFTSPWQPWKTTKLIAYPESKPVMYRIGNQIVGHPLAIAELKEAIRMQKDK